MQILTSFVTSLNKTNLETHGPSLRTNTKCTSQLDELVITAADMNVLVTVDINVLHNRAQNSSDTVATSPLDNHHTGEQDMVDII